MITVHLPANLASEFQASSVLMVDAHNCAEVLEALNQKYPGMASWLAEPDGRFRQHLSVFIGARRLPPQAHTSIPVENGEEVWIIHAISGG